MLSQANNELLTRVGPGTPMGDLLRRFWFPALLEEEIAEPDCSPVRVRLLGEDLVAFRDTEGRIGIIDEFCRHRRASLYFGRNEECGLRCVYHGWKYDVHGRCVDLPSEPNPNALQKKAAITAYPTEERGGMVWVYMGPADKKPARLPDIEFAHLPAGQRTAIKRHQQCNWAQAVEGAIDSSHVSFLHSNIDAMGTGNFGRPLSPMFTADRHPVFDVRETDYGLAIGARRRPDDENYFWRVTQCLVPFFQMIPPAMDGNDSSTAPYGGHAWVPIDDENTWTWSFGAQPHRPMTDEEFHIQGARDGMWGPVDENFHPALNKANEYLIDREKQRTQTYTGIDGIPNQDAAVQESMGPIVDRSKELLGTSDRAIITWRKLMIELARDLADGKEPKFAHQGEAFNVRSAACILPQHVDFQEGAAELMAGKPVEDSYGSAARREVAE